MSGSAAFFDLDHVLIPGSSMYLMARDLRSHDVYRARDLVGVAARRAKIRLARESDRDLSAMRDEALASIKGCHHHEMEAWGRQIAAYEILPRVYPDIAKMIAAHCAAGDRTYLVTPTARELAEPVARSLDMTAAAGSILETGPDGRYTGRRIGALIQGAAKAELISELAEREHIDLRRCHVYSNTIEDKQLLTWSVIPTRSTPTPDCGRWRSGAAGPSTNSAPSAARSWSGHRPSSRSAHSSDWATWPGSYGPGDDEDVPAQSSDTCHPSRVRGPAN